MTPASLIHVWLRAMVPSCFLVSGSFTRMNLQGCRLPAEGASWAAAMICLRWSSGIGWGLYLRTLLRVLMASNTFMRVLVEPWDLMGSHMLWMVDSWACLLAEFSANQRYSLPFFTLGSPLCCALCDDCTVFMCGMGSVPVKIRAASGGFRASFCPGAAVRAV